MFGVGAAVLSPSACSPGMVAHPDATVSDSNGIRIVEWAYPDTVEGPTFVLAEEPLFEVGGPAATGPYALERVGPVLRIERGVVVAAAGATELRFFDNDGTYVRTVAGDETRGIRFAAIRGLGNLPGGRVFVFDLSHGVMIIDADGRIVEHYSTGNRWFSRALANATVVGTGGPVDEVASADAGLLRTRTTVRFLNLESGQTTDVVSLPGLTWYESVDGHRSYPSWATRVNFNVSSSRVVAAWTGEPSVKVFDEAGRLETIVRWEQAMESVTPNQIESFVSTVDRERQDTVREMLKRESTVGQIINGIMLDEDGNLWVRPEPTGRAAVQRFLMFATDGSNTGYMELPTRMRVASISSDEVAGLWFVEDVPVVRVYPVREVRRR